jgi:hypothetical protein
MRKVSNKTTKVIGMRAGGSFPMYFVTEYPKSGGTWLARMVSDAMQVPFPQHYVLPIGFRSVVQNHWRYSPRLRRVFYLYRDGRDVMTSFFFHRMRTIRSRSEPNWEVVNRRAERLFGRGFDPDDTLSLLPLFIENEFTRPRDARTNWRDHVTQWFDPARPGVAYLSYEMLRTDPHLTLKRGIETVTGKPIEDWRIESAVDRNSMVRQTGRKAGQEDRSHFVRRGVVGDWRNHFTREAAEVFNRFAGDALVLLGYEDDQHWVRRQRFIDDLDVVPATEAEALSA